MLESQSREELLGELLKKGLHETTENLREISRLRERAENHPGLYPEIEARLSQLNGLLERFVETWREAFDSPSFKTKRKTESCVKGRGDEKISR